jgi:hypothetical protein
MTPLTVDPLLRWAICTIPLLVHEKLVALLLLLELHEELLDERLNAAEDDKLRSDDTDSKDEFLRRVRPPLYRLSLK